jgi:hypothetical protein
MLSELWPASCAKRAAIRPLQALLLQTIQSFKDLLANMPAAAAEAPAADGEDGPESAEAAWRTFALYSLRSFLRKYYLELAPLAEQVENEMFADGAVAPDVREVAQLSLHM